MADPPGQQTGQAQVYLAASEGVQKQVPAFPRTQGFSQQMLTGRQAGPAQLGVQQRLNRLHLRAVELPMGGGIKTLDYRLGQFVGKGHAPAIPAWHGGFFRGAATYIGGHGFHAHQFQQASGEQKPIPRLEPCNKPFLDTAQVLAAAALAPELELDTGITDDGADAHAMAACEACIRDTPDAVLIGLHAAVIRISGE